MKVYILDDEPKVRNGLCAAIHAYKPEWPMPLTAASANEAWEDTRLWEADLLFLDVRMPGMSGFELLDKLKEAEPDRDIQVVIVSGYAEFEYAQTAIRLGVKDYLLKPVSREKLFALLDRLEERWNHWLHEEGEMEALVSEAPSEISVAEVKHRLAYANPVVQKIGRYIIGNPSGTLKVEELAAMAFVHANYLSELFKKETGVNLSAFILDNRICLAKKALRDPCKKIYMVASECGFSSQHYFSHVFRKRTGMTPYQYRIRFSADSGVDDQIEEAEHDSPKSNSGC